MTRLAEQMLERPRAVLAALAMITVAFAAGLPRLQTDVGYRAFLGETHPAVATLDGFLERYRGGLTLHAVWSCTESPACEDALDEASLGMADAVGQALSNRPGIRRVIHPGNAPILVPAFGGPELHTLARSARSARDAEAHARLVGRALEDPFWVGELVSDDGRVGAIIVELDSSASEVARAGVAALEEALAPHAPGFVFHRVGGPIEFVIAGDELDHAMSRIVPVMVALVAIGLLVLLRSVAATAVALVAVGVAVLWTMGALGWIGWARNSLTQTLPPLVLVIGVCDGIHVISRYAARCAARPPADRAARRRLVAESLAEVARPCLLTTLTTGAGFVSFATAELGSFVEFGWIAAFGVVAALLLSFTLLPIALVMLPAERVAPARATRSWSQQLLRLSDLSRRHAPAIVVAALVAGLLGTVGFTRLRVDSSFEELYGQDSDVVRWAAFVAAELSPPDRLEIDLALPKGTAIAAPEVRDAVSRLGAEVAREGEVAAPRSLFSHPHWQELVLSAGTREASGLDHWVDFRERHLRVSFATDKLPQDVMRGILARTRAALAALPEGFDAVATGPSRWSTTWSRRSAAPSCGASRRRR